MPAPRKSVTAWWLMWPDIRLIGCKKAGIFLGVVAAPIIKLRRRWVMMPDRFLHVRQLRAVLKGGRDEGRAHRMCRVAAPEANPRRVFRTMRRLIASAR
jgi:hypothetical protein